MTGYVINPWFFYWLQIINALAIFIWIIGVVLLAIVAICWFAPIVGGDLTAQESYIKIRKALLISIGVCILAILIPSKETLISMELAKHVTYENVNIFIEKTEEAADYIVDKIEDSKK